MRCLITGANGFVGSHLTEALAARGDEVTALVRPHSNRRWIERLPIRFVAGGLDDSASLESAVRNQDVVYHVAGVIAAPSRRLFFKTNVEGTRRLVEACRRAAPNLKRFLHVSSLAATGPSRDDAPVDESTPCRPISPYGESKLAGERIVMAARDLPATAIRPHVVAGPRDHALLPFFRIVRRGIWAILGERKYLSLIFVSDLVAGMIRAADAPQAAGQVYFLSGLGTFDHDTLAGAIARAVGAPRKVRVRVPHAVLRAAAAAQELAARCTGKHPFLTRYKVREISQKRWTCSTAKAERELGFAPRVSLDEGIALTARWYRDEGLL